MCRLFVTGINGGLPPFLARARSSLFLLHADTSTQFNMQPSSILSSILSLTDQIRDIAQNPNESSHGLVKLLQLVDELKLAVETPTETILRLIYQVRYQIDSSVCSLPNSSI